MADLRTIEVKVRPVLDTVTVRPGDKLIVRYGVPLTRERTQLIADQLCQQLPGVDVCVTDAAQILVYRPDGDDE